MMTCEGVSGSCCDVDTYMCGASRNDGVAQVAAASPTRGRAEINPQCAAFILIGLSLGWRLSLHTSLTRRSAIGQ